MLPYKYTISCRFPFIYISHLTLHPTPTHPTAIGELTFATDFSGMEAPAYALRNLGIAAIHKSAADHNPNFQPPPPPPRPPPICPVEGCQGTTYQILTPGTAGSNTITPGSTATVHAVGKIQFGRQFWSTKDPGQRSFEATFGIGNVIKGWDHGCLGMKVGEVRRLTIPGQEAYGKQGFPAWGIPPNATTRSVCSAISAK